MTIINNTADIIEDIKAPEDRGELTSLIEPLCITATARSCTQLNDLALTLVAKNAALRQSFTGQVGTCSSLPCPWHELLLQQSYRGT